eukprot:653770-Pelagomonas_calceolata.AAC.2
MGWAMPPAGASVVRNADCMGDMDDEEDQHRASGADAPFSCSPASSGGTKVTALTQSHHSLHAHVLHPLLTSKYRASPPFLATSFLLLSTLFFPQFFQGRTLFHNRTTPCMHMLSTCRSPASALSLSGSPPLRPPRATPRCCRPAAAGRWRGGAAARRAPRLLAHTLQVTEQITEERVGGGAAGWHAPHLLAASEYKYRLPGTCAGKDTELLLRIPYVFRCGVAAWHASRVMHHHASSWVIITTNHVSPHHHHH